MDKKDQTEILTLVAFIIIVLLVLWIADVQYQYAFFIAVVAAVAGMLRILWRRKRE
ncbi:MAG: hypothetical protein SVM80_01705 [Halobacteriota archaeon]|nr:hypothetical protein [Halobacteriota archaeon]